MKTPADVDLHDRVTEAYYGELGEKLMEVTRRRIHWICEQTDGEAVLDVGCSQGITSVLLAREGKNVLGIDISPRAVDEARAFLDREEEDVRERVTFVRADFLQYDFGDTKFDTVIMTEVLEHLFEPEAFVEKAHSLLKKDGTLIVTVPFGINDFPDHKKTYYFLDAYELIRRRFPIERTAYIGKWICFSASGKAGRPDDGAGISAESVRELEKNFFLIERSLVDEVASLRRSLRECGSRYKSAERTAGSLAGDLKKARAEKTETESVLRAELKRAEAQKAAAESRMRKALENLEAEKAQSEAVLREALERLRAEKAQTESSLRKELKTARERLAETRADSDALTKEKTAVETVLRDCRNKYRRAKNTIRHLDGKFDEAVDRYRKCRDSAAFRLGRTLLYEKKKLFDPVSLKKKIGTLLDILSSQRHAVSSRDGEGQESPVPAGGEDRAEAESLAERVRRSDGVRDFAGKTGGGPVALLYGELSLNVVDGSSVWLSSVYNVLASSCHVILVSKENVRNDLIVSNFVGGSRRTLLLQPRDLGLDGEIDAAVVPEVLTALDAAVANVQLVVVRGMAAAVRLSESHQFKSRLFPYLTDFFKPTGAGPRFLPNCRHDLRKLSYQVHTWLWQTEEMRKWVETEAGLSGKNSVLFPPVLPDIRHGVSKQRRRDRILIGYAGKIQPDWGVMELIEEAERLREKGFRIGLRIVSSKISGRSDLVQVKDFAGKMRKMLGKDFVEFVENVNRQASIKLLSDVDYIWSYRPGYFEENTLEISTKLLEAVALGKPVICYPNAINKGVLGEDYPYYITAAGALGDLLRKEPSRFDMSRLSGPVSERFSFKNRKGFFDPFISPVKRKTIVFAGDDFKFIDHFYSCLKRKGYRALKDVWKWGGPVSADRSEALYESADVIFCEWGLANAVWYSKRNTGKKPLFIRIHLQEVMGNARRFGPEIRMENVTKVIFVSKRVRDLAVSRWKWPEEKCVVIPNYVLTDDFRTGGREKPGLNFAMVGITPQRKRFDRAVSLMKRLLAEYPEARLYVKGKRPEEYPWMHGPARKHELEYYDELYRTIDGDPALKKAVIFDGFDNDMPQWYKKIDFILSPSDFESFHYAVADGVAAGCLPIVWNWEEAREIYTEKWVVEDVEEAVRRVESCLALERDDFQRIVASNRDIIVRKYGYEKIYRMLETLLESCG